MATRDWALVRALFEEALRHEGGARAAFLDGLDAEAPEDAATVQALVAAHERDPDFLEEGVLPHLAARLAADPDDAGAPRRIGPYRIERPLGEGGMGVVFLARQEDGPFRRRVALKLARWELPAGYLAERFAAERDILARLTHPSIAHLYDGGITPDGRPYLAMELVEGTPITEHCDRYGLGVRDRLALLQVVCRAVDFAHRHLVIHRDLKPSNILVTPPSAEAGPLGEVKLLDFGVAKVLQPDGPTPATADASRDGPRTVVALTPAYAAPEQLRRGRVTTATDVYGIGVLAYELVAGRRPHALDGLPLAEVERVVSTADPAPPSAARRPTDLDHVILKALRAEPEQRYATPRELAEDLQRVLDGRPVRARTPTLAYRASRFVRRNRGRVLAAAAAALALLATTRLALQQARAATALARRAAAERARSDSASRRAQRINRFLQGVLATANPSWYVESPEKGPDVTVLRALELAAARMERELADDPETRADIHHTLGDTYRVLGAYPRMAAHFDSALALRRRVFRAPHPKLADALFYAHIGRLGEGRWDEGAAMLDSALAIQRARDEGNNLPYIVEAMAGLRLRAGFLADAVAEYDAGLAVARARYAEDHPIVASLSMSRARALDRLGEPLPPLGPAAARAPLLAVQLAARRGDYRAADSVLRARIAAWPAGSYYAVHYDLTRVETVLVPQRRWADARAALEADRRALGPLGRELPGSAAIEEARARSLAATVALAEGRAARAADEARGALALIDRALGGARFDLFWDSRNRARSALAGAHLARGEPAAAVPLLRENLRALEARRLRGPSLDSARRELARAASVPVERPPASR